MLTAVETDIEHVVLSFQTLFRDKSFQILVFYNTYCSNNLKQWNLIEM